MLILLGLIGPLLFLWRHLVNKIKTGLSYALGFFIAILATIATYFYPLETPSPIFLTMLTPLVTHASHQEILDETAK